MLTCFKRLQGPRGGRGARGPTGKPGAKVRMSPHCVGEKRKSIWRKNTLWNKLIFMNMTLCLAHIVSVCCQIKQVNPCLCISSRAYLLLSFYILAVGALHKFPSHFDSFRLRWQPVPVLCSCPQGTSGNDGPPGPPGERVSIGITFWSVLVNRAARAAGPLCLNRKSARITAICHVK